MPNFLDSARLSNHRKCGPRIQRDQLFFGFLKSFKLSIFEFQDKTNEQY
jgi:hypothetical protein